MEVLRQNFMIRPSTGVHESRTLSSIYYYYYYELLLIADASISFNLGHIDVTEIDIHVIG